MVSTSEATELDQLAALHPIILQTQAAVGAPLMDQVRFSKLQVSGEGGSGQQSSVVTVTLPTAFLTGEGTSELAEQAVDQVADLQHQPVWRTAGVLC